MRTNKLGRDNLTREDRMGKRESTASIIVTAILFILSVVAMGAFVLALSK